MEVLIHPGPLIQDLAKSHPDCWTRCLLSVVLLVGNIYTFAVWKWKVIFIQPLLRSWRLQMHTLDLLLVGEGSLAFHLLQLCVCPLTPVVLCPTVDKLHSWYSGHSGLCPRAFGFVFFGQLFRKFQCKSSVCPSFGRGTPLNASSQPCSCFLEFSSVFETFCKHIFCSFLRCCS